MNYPQNNYSSGSDEDQADACNLATPDGRTEQHSDKHCKYKKIQGYVNGKIIYIHVRICLCGRYRDRKYLLSSDLSPAPMDGKEIHFYPGCKWTRNKYSGYWGLQNVLTACCNGCIMQQKNSHVSTMNMPRTQYAS